MKIVGFAVGLIKTFLWLIKNMATEVSKLRRSRTYRRNAVTRNVLSKIDDLITQHMDDNSTIEVAALLETLNDEVTKIKVFDKGIQELIAEDDELENEVDEAMKFHMKIKMGIEKLKKQLRKLNETMETKPIVMNNQNSGVELPKFQLKSFDGNPRNSKPFIEAFEATIHSKANLSNVEKFTYLKGFLKDTALNMIEGFPLTNDNYTNALELLTQRYGNTQLIISSHMHDLIKIGKVSNHNNILKMYDNIESNVRALKDEGINPSHFGALAVLIILEVTQ